MPTPGDTLVDARAAALRVSAASLGGSNQLQLRNGFLVRGEPTDPLPLLARLLRASGKDGLHLKVYLMTIWLLGARSDARSTRRAYESLIPVSDAADLVGLVGGAAASQRRIMNSFRYLADAHLIEIGRRSSGELPIRLLSDRGDGSDHERPGVEAKRTGHVPGGYLTVPGACVSDGYLAVLSAPALAVLIAFRLLHQQRRERQQGLYISETVRVARFGFSEQTYYRGTAELVDRGILKRWRQHLRSDASFGAPMVRNAYWFRAGLFSSDAMQRPQGAWETLLAGDRDEAAMSWPLDEYDLSET